MKNKHFLFLRVRLAFAIFVFAMAFMGCDNNKPLSLLIQESTQPSSDIVSELADCYKDIQTDAQKQAYLLAFDKVCVDNALILTTVASPPTSLETTPATKNNGVTLADIVSDVAKNGVRSAFKGQTVTITAPVYIKIEARVDRNTSIALFTYNESVSFFVLDFEGADDLAHLNIDTSYTFTLEISDIKRNTADPNITIVSDVLQRPVRNNKDILNITLNQLVSSASTGAQTYVAKTVRLRATVQIDNTRLENGIALQTNNRSVILFILDIQNPHKLDRYKAGNSYQFVLHIQSVTPAKNPDEYTIVAGIAND